MRHCLLLAVYDSRDELLEERERDDKAQAASLASAGGKSVSGRRKHNSIFGPAGLPGYRKLGAIKALESRKKMSYKLCKSEEHPTHPTESTAVNEDQQGSVYSTKWSAQWRSTPSPRRWNAKFLTSRHTIVACELRTGSMKASRLRSCGSAFSDAAIASWPSVSCGWPGGASAVFRNSFVFVLAPSTSSPRLLTVTGVFPSGGSVAIAVIEEAETNRFCPLTAGVVVPERAGDGSSDGASPSIISITLISIRRSRSANECSSRVPRSFSVESSSLMRLREERACRDSRVSAKTIKAGKRTGAAISAN